MQISEIEVKNFRSIEHQSFVLDDYSLLIGPNNSGKSNVIDSILAFYEEDSFEEGRDHPKFTDNGKESWVEIEFSLSDQEYKSLEDKWKSGKQTLRVRNYMHEGDHKGFWAYGEGADSPSGKFCPKKDVKNGLLGDPIYVPAAGELDDFAKLSGPSPLRSVVNGVVGNLVQSSEAFSQLKSDFQKFSDSFREEEAENSQSLNDITKQINEGISEWGAAFKLGIDPVDEKDIVKRLINIQISEDEFEEEVDPDALGQGFQRNLIYTLIRVAADNEENYSPSKGDKFNPSLSLILFEEPEAFLHPPQARNLSKNLQKIASQKGQQVILTSHSPIFVSFHSSDISAISRLHREQGRTQLGQISETRLNEIFQDNQELNQIVENAGWDVHSDDLRQDMEAVKYFMWLDRSRCGLFFADHVLLVEGESELVLLNHLIQTEDIDLPSDQIFILDCLGKFNMHRFMNLLGPLKIEHSVLLDDDNGRPPHPEIRGLIENSANDYTLGIASFQQDIESFLDIPEAGDGHRKPQHILLQYQDSEIHPDRIEELQYKVSQIVGSEPSGATA